MSTFTIKYNSNGGESGVMQPSIVTYGNNTKLSLNQFVREGYTFKGWTAIRMSDKKTCFEHPETKERRYFTPGKQPTGWKLFTYRNGGFVAKLSRIDGDVIIMNAEWVKNDILIPSPPTSASNKKIIDEYLKTKNIVLYGNITDCLTFYNKYKNKINITKILSHDTLEKEYNDIDIPVKDYSAKNLNPNDYIIICQDVKIRLDTKYRQMKQALKKAGRFITEDYIRGDIADMILGNKKLWLWFGYCQADVLRKNIFGSLTSIKNSYTLTAFRYELDTLKNSYKYEDCIELLKICDVLTYVPLIVANEKMDFKFEELVPNDTKFVTIPRIAFRGYYPYRDSDIEAFHKFSVDGKLHWPFAYQEKIIDDMILDGKSDDEIYTELMREDLISPEVIKRNLKLAYKFIQISESTTDIKILDFIKENIDKRLLYRDGLHYHNFMYFEIARRMANVMGINCIDEINILETEISNKGTQFIDYTEIPLLPCVVKTLGLDFINDDTLWRVRTTEFGSWRGTKTIIKTMTRKEWIYAYIEYTRACISLCHYWNVPTSEK